MPASDRLTVEDLRVSFARGSLEAVRGVSLTIAPGEAYGLVGESGSGKSLTCRAILPGSPWAGSAVAAEGDPVPVRAVPSSTRIVRIPNDATSAESAS